MGSNLWRKCAGHPQTPQNTEPVCDLEQPERPGMRVRLFGLWHEISAKPVRRATNVSLHKRRVSRFAERLAESASSRRAVAIVCNLDVFDELFGKPPIGLNDVAADQIDGSGNSEGLFYDSNGGTAYSLTVISTGTTWLTINRAISPNKG